MNRNKKVLYEHIIRSIAKEVKSTLYESTDMYRDIYQQLVDACQEIPEITIQESYDRQYVARVLFKDYYYRLLDKMTGINTQGETWINISPALSATIVAIGSRSGKRYSTRYGKFKNIQQLVNRLKKDIEREKPNMPINTDTIQPSKAAIQMAKKLVSRESNIKLPPMYRKAQELYINTFAPVFWIDDRILRNIDYNQNDPYSVQLKKRSIVEQNKIINNISKQIEYNLNNDEYYISVNIKFGVSYNYFAVPQYDQDGLKQLGSAVIKYLKKNYKKIYIDDNDYEFKVILQGESYDILNLIENALDIIDSYEQFINEHFDEYIEL